VPFVVFVRTLPDGGMTRDFKEDFSPSSQRTQKFFFFATGTHHQQNLKAQF
jgi:hypothetical protein